MAKTGSFIKLDRGLKSNPLWLEKPFSKGQAWVDLLLLAQGVDREKEYRGAVQKQKPGEIYTSILFLTKRWGWSRSTVYRFFDRLIDEKMITVKGWGKAEPVEEKERTKNDTSERTRNGTTNGTIVTVVNWAFYQHRETNIDTTDDTTERTNNDTHNRKHIRESNKEKAIKNNPPKSPHKGDSPPPEVKRGTDAFRNQSHLLLKPEEGTEDDIPVRYRELCGGDFATYWRMRNQ